jgi:hypothetical protein
VSTLRLGFSLIASRFESCALPAWNANEDLRRFIGGFLMQLGVDSTEIVNNAVAIDYVLDLTSGISGTRRARINRTLFLATSVSNYNVSRIVQRNEIPARSK